MRTETDTCQHCGDEFAVEDVAICDHAILCGPCDAAGQCWDCRDQRAADAYDEAAVDARIEERAS